MHRYAGGLILLVAVLLPSFAAGQEKAKPHVIIPAADEVVKIKFTAAKAFPGGPFELTLTKSAETEPLLTWLKDVGWDYSKSGNAAVIRIAPIAHIVVSQKNKGELHFIVGQRLIIAGDRFWGIDSKRLEAAINRVRAPAK
jgi:hypothetical protein